MPFLFVPGLQTYDQALAFAGLAEHAGPLLPIRVLGVQNASERWSDRPGSTPSR
jgi:hypothetical protein